MLVGAPGASGEDLRADRGDGAQQARQIAVALGLSIDTVKWHLKNIYGKLGVSGRDEAVAWMREAAQA